MGRRITRSYQSFQHGEIDPRSVNATQLEQHREGVALARNFTLNTQRNLEARSNEEPLLSHDGVSHSWIGGFQNARPVPEIDLFYHPQPVIRGDDGPAQSAFGIDGEFYGRDHTNITSSRNTVINARNRVHGVTIKGLRQVPNIMGNEPFWRINPGYVSADTLSGQIPEKDDDRVFMRGVGTLDPDIPLTVSSISNSLVPLQQHFGHNYIKRNGMRVGVIRFKPNSLHLGDDGKPRMIIKFPRAELDNLGSKHVTINGKRYAREYNKAPRVDGAELLRALDNLVVYVYSLDDDRTYRLPFKEAQVETEWHNPRNNNSNFANPEDSITLMWDVAKLDVPFKSAYQLDNIQSSPDYTYNYCIGEGGMRDEEVFPYPSDRYDIDIGYGHNVRRADMIANNWYVTMSDLPIRTPVDVTLLFDQAFAVDLVGGFSEAFAIGDGLTYQNRMLSVFTQRTLEPPPWQATAPGANDYRYRMETAYDKIVLANVSTQYFRREEAPTKHFSFIEFNHEDDGTILGVCSENCIWFVEQSTGRRLLSVVPFGDLDTAIDPRLIRYAADENAIIIAHPDLDPFIMRRLGKGIFGKAELKLNGIDQAEGRFRPHAVAFLNERLFFAGTEDKPRGVWGSKAGDPRDFRWETADTELPTSPFFFEIKGGVSRIHDIITQNYMGFLTKEALWFRDSNTDIGPNDFAVRKATDRGSDPRSPNVNIRGRVGYLNEGLGEAVLATYTDDSKGYEVQPLSLPNAHLFLNPDNRDHGVGQWYDESGELFYLFTAPGDGTLVCTTILPGANGFFGSTHWDFHRTTDWEGATYEEIDGFTHRRGGRLVKLDTPRQRPVLGFWAGKGEVWVIYAREFGRLTELVRVRTADFGVHTAGRLSDDLEAEAEFTSLPVTLTNNEGSGVPGSANTHKRRIVGATLDVEGDMSEEDPAYILVGDEWKAVTEPGLVKFQGLRGHSENPQFSFFTTSHIRLKGLDLDTVFTR